MNATTRHVATSTVALALLAASASAQHMRGDVRSDVAPPPSATSTGGETPAPIDRSAPPTSPKLHGRSIETRGELYPGTPTLAGLDAVASAKRNGLTIVPSANVAPKVVEAQLHERQLALHRGELLTVFQDPVPPKEPAPVVDAPSTNDAEPKSSHVSWLGYGLVALVAVGVFLQRRRRARH